MKTATPCAMCKEDANPEIHSDTFCGIVCKECAKCIRDGLNQLEIYGAKAGATTKIKFER